MEKREACQQVPKDVPQPLQKMLRRSSDPDPINYHNHEEIGLCNSKSIPTISKMVAMHRANRNVLGLPDCPTQELEQCSLLVYDSMEAPTRVFHNLDHIFDLVTQMNNRSVGPDPIAISAIAFHDVIYYQVDGGLSDRQRPYLHDVIIEHDDGSISISQKPLGRSVELVMDIFGYSYGQVLNPFKGMNEFLSACIGCRVYESLDKGRCSKLTDSLNAKRAACIEATVPFRGPDEQGRNPPEALFDRLKVVNVKYNLGWDEEETILAVQRSVDLSNRDIDNFSWTDRAAFLSNTWKLLPESNVTLREKVTFSISEMALAMKKQAGFFEFLDPDTIFFSFRNPELEKVVKEKTEQARQNIDTALTYMRCKYLALSVLSAIAELTGGDTPICLFCGDRQISESRMHSSTIEDYLDYKRNPEEGIKVHEEVLRILREGRKLETDFDKRNSPLGAYLYSRLGNDGLTDCIKYAVHPMAKESGMELLRSLPKVVAMDILGAVSKLALTRTSEIRKVMNQINL